MENNKLPKWYQSSQGPQISMTVKGVLLSLIPAAKMIWGVDIGNETVDAIVDAVMVIIFAVITLRGYARTKKNTTGTVSV